MEHDLFGNETSKTPDLTENYISDRDQICFQDRVNRLKYLHKINPGGLVLAGQSELVLTYREIQLCYIDGHFLATIVLSQAFVEKIVFDFYMRKGFDKIAKKGFSAILEHAKENKIIKEFIIKRLNKMRLIRNPITHSKSFDYEHSLDNRSFKNRISPLSQLERDAKESIETATFIASTDLEKIT